MFQKCYYFLRIIFCMVIFLSIMFFIKPKVFTINLKDVHVTYSYYGYGSHSCGKTNVLVATLSRPNATDLRMAVRNSWRREIPSTMTHKFFIGWTWNETQRQLNEEESKKFGDIVFTDIFDSYTNITLKMISLFQWQQFYCPDVDYFLREDEDTVMDFPRFLYFLNNEFEPLTKSLNDMAIFGCFIHDAPVQRDPKEKWYISKEIYEPSIYPDYVIGPSFLITTKAVKSILAVAKNYYNFGSADDALFTGIIAQDVGITRINATKHFAAGNPLNRWTQECDPKGTPFLLSVFDEAGEIELIPRGHNKVLKKLKELNCSISI